MHVRDKISAETYYPYTRPGDMKLGMFREKQILNVFEDQEAGLPAMAATGFSVLEVCRDA